MPVPVIVIISPRDSELQQTWDLLKWLADEVRKAEPEVTSYRYWKSGSKTAAESTDFIVFFELVSFCVCLKQVLVGSYTVRIESTESLAARRGLKHHQEVARLIKAQDLLRQPLKYLVLGDEGGWKR